MSKTLLIFSGGGDPGHPSYSHVYRLIESAARDRGFDRVITTRWPGHQSYCTASAMSHKSAVPVAVEYLRQLSSPDIQLHVAARSFGCSVILRCLELIVSSNLFRICLWGPPPLHVLHQMFVEELAKTIESGRNKGVNISPDFFRNCYSIESMLCRYRANARLIVATGTRDVYCRPAFLRYLSSLGAPENVSFLTVPGVGHDVKEDPKSKYLNAMLGEVNEAVPG